jgi:predicted methyltransferase
VNRRQFTLAASGLLVTCGPSGSFAGPSPSLLSVVNGPQRSAKNRARDPFRHPAESLAFWGLAPGMTVVEIDPSGGYWTEILAPYLKATGGRYIAALEGDPAAFKTRFADASIWGDIQIVAFEDGAGVLAPPGTTDLLLTARNIHDWMWTTGELSKALASFRLALKPGAILAVEEHRADPRPMVADAKDGYVATEINANPKDTKDYPFGVWTLPPTLRTHEKGQPTPAGFDPAKYPPIGESDRMTLKFTRV